MLFPKRQTFLAADTGNALGATLNKTLTRDFHCGMIEIILKGTVTGVMATDNPDSLQALLKRVTLSVSDGANTSTIVSATGPQLLEYAKQVAGSLDRATQAAINTDATAAFTLVYPIYFMPPNLASPVAEMFLCPFPSFNTDPVLRIELATQADMDQHASATFAIAAGVSVQVVTHRFQPTIPKWKVFRTELTEIVKTFSADAANQEALEIPAPGVYTGILMQGYTSAAARGNPSRTGGEFRLQLLDTVLRRFSLEHLTYQNERSMSPITGTGASVFTASYFLDFLNDGPGQCGDDFGSVLDTNPLEATGARAKLYGDIAGGTGVTIKFLTHRVFGDIRPLVRGLKV
jgi:hypothetical protein